LPVLPVLELLRSVRFIKKKNNTIPSSDKTPAFLAEFEIYFCLIFAITDYRNNIVICSLDQWEINLNDKIFFTQS